MPELPEAERGRRLLHDTCVGRTVTSVFVDRDDRIVFDNVAPRTWARAIRHQRLTDTGRHGKYIWLATDKEVWASMHFGMTGQFHVRGPESLPLADRPRFCKFELTLDDGRRLAMTNPRRLGRVRLHRTVPTEDAPLNNLGPDPFHAMPGLDAFREQLGRRRTAIKALLLDQGFLAGIGNWIADEVLYQAGINPHTRAHELSPEASAGLHTAITNVIETACAANADKDLFPDDWLFHYRWGKGRGANRGGESGRHPASGGELPSGKPITFDQIGGRTTAWVPHVQS